MCPRNRECETIGADKIAIVEAGECVEEKEAAIGLGGEVGKQGSGVSLPDAEFDEVSADVLGLELANIEEQGHEACGVAVVVGLIPSDPTTVEICEVGEGRQRVGIGGHETAGPPGERIEARMRASLAQKIAGVPRDGGQHGAWILAHELLQTVLWSGRRDVGHQQPSSGSALCLIIAKRHGF